MIRARVFIGNLVRGPITRDDLIDLFKPFGKLLALTFFQQGYAFVQFSEAAEADAACTGLHGKRWKGAIIDVHLAMTGPGGKKKNVDRDRDAYDSSRKRRYDDYSRSPEPSVLDETAEQNKRNRKVAMQDPTNNDDLSTNAMADTLICGGCRFVTCDFELYKDHRVAGCRNIKDKDEPKAIRCASCSQKFMSAWALMCHLTDFHRMMLYKVEENVPTEEAQAALVDKLVDSSPAKDEPPTKNARRDGDGLNGTEPSAASTVPIGTASSVVAAAPSIAVSANEGEAGSAPIQPAQWTPLTGQTILSASAPANSSLDSANVSGGDVSAISAMYGMR